MAFNNFDPEIILLTIPAAEECGIYITNIVWNDSPETLWNELHTELSSFGLLYNLYVAPSKYKNENNDIFYSLAKFYSKKAATRALGNSGKLAINEHSIKITKMPHEGHKAKHLKLNSHSMEELIDYYFGFNYLSSQVTQLVRVPSEEDAVVRFLCVVNAATKDHLVSEGIGIGEAPVTDDKLNKLTAYKIARKFAVENAKSDALSKFVIIELSNGKRLMEVNYQRPEPFYIETAANHLACQVDDLHSDPDEDSDDSLNINEPLNESQWIENLSDDALDKLLNDSYDS